METKEERAKARLELQAKEAGERLKEERKRLGFTQDAFAAKIGIHRNTQVKYETGKRSFDNDYLSKIKDLGASETYILAGEHHEHSATTAASVARPFFTQLATRYTFDIESMTQAFYVLALLITEREGKGWFDDGIGQSEEDAAEKLINAVLTHPEVFFTASEAVFKHSLYLNIPAWRKLEIILSVFEFAPKELDSLNVNLNIIKHMAEAAVKEGATPEHLKKMGLRLDFI